jgi:hypothetical protein
VNTLVTRHGHKKQPRCSRIENGEEIEDVYIFLHGASNDDVLGCQEKELRDPPLKASA